MAAIVLAKTIVFLYTSDGKAFCVVCQIFEFFMENFFACHLRKFFRGYLSNFDISFDIVKKKKKVLFKNSN